MISLQGVHICRVDSKGRFMLPVALKNQVDAALGEGFMIKRSISATCLDLYPKSNWDDMLGKITRKLNMFRNEDRDFVRAYSTGLVALDIDSTGRLLIPRDLAVFAGITGDIVLAAMMNGIEIWDKTKYDEVVRETQKDMGARAEKLLGNINLFE
jgi:MraZ protein